MDDADLLTGYVETWWAAINDFTQLLEDLEPEVWDAPTDLPGWSVHDVVAHTAHLEAILAGAPEETVEIGEPAHVSGPMGHYTEQGVVARRDHGPDDLINELREAATSRHTALVADPPTDPGGQPPRVFGGVDWHWARLLGNRVIDVWMHQQDVRRAVARPGGFDSPAARHTVAALAQGLGFVLGKRVGAAPGTSALLVVEGHDPVLFEVGEDGRARPIEVSTAPTESPRETPTARLSMDAESFIVLAGGRRSGADAAVDIEGDRSLGRQLIEAMAVTP